MDREREWRGEKERDIGKWREVTLYAPRNRGSNKYVVRRVDLEMNARYYRGEFSRCGKSVCM